MSTATLTPATATFLGHPRGLFLLFFVEMWERFSYYGMRALLVFYMTKGFLHFNDGPAYRIYGAYTSLVYATPFLGGMLADKLLGSRRAVILGGMLMAAGHLLMTFEDKTAFYVALALLICGNGFFKPNISTMVGAMYPAGSPDRDGGFTIFYMGINLGAAMSPLICGYVGETFGWHYGFGLATIGMLTGLVTFAAHGILSRVLIAMTALVTVSSMIWFHFGDLIQLTVNGPVALALLVAAFISIAALSGGGIPDDVGRARNPDRLRAPALPQIPWLSAGMAVYLGTAAAVTAAAFLVQNSALTGVLLSVIGCSALGILITDALRAERIERERMFVVFILIFFSMLFFAFFEQAGSSLNNFTDRNVDRIVGASVLTGADVGRKLERIPISSAILGRSINGRQWTLTMVDAAQVAARQTVMTAPSKLSREEIQKRADEAALKAALAVPSSISTKPVSPAPSEKEPDPDSTAENETKANDDAATDWTTNLQRAVLAKELQPALTSVEVTPELVGMKVGGRELKASVFQAANPVYILVLGLVLTFVWKIMATGGVEPNTTVKFALALFQLGLGFGAVWLGARNCSTFGIVGIEWLLVGYLFHTTGELCLSPVGLSMVTRLSPARLVNTVMGAWFLAAAFSNYLAGMIAGLTGVGHGDDSGNNGIPLPIETVHVYGSVFAKIAIASVVSGLILLALSPWLVKWMHPETTENENAVSG